MDAALARRAALLREGATDAVRLIHDDADGLPGFVVERFGTVLIAQFHAGRVDIPVHAARDICTGLMERFGCTATYRKDFPRGRDAASPALHADHANAAPWIGVEAPAELHVAEHGLRWIVRPYDGFSCGLFLENRDNRAIVRSLAHGMRVLNLFAYTCAFSVCAAAGGAAETVSVDVSRKSLEWGKRNFTLNGFTLDTHRFIASDALDYLRRARRQERQFDLIIADAPSFGRDKSTGAVFSLRDDLDTLAAACVERLAPAGRLLISVNHRPMTTAALERALKHGAGGRGLTIESHPALPADFAGDAAYAKSVLARFE